MSNVGYALIEHFPVAVERRHRPDLIGRPVIIGGYPYERKMVYAASSEATALGVRPGLGLRQAQQLCPTAVFLPLDEARYEQTSSEFLAIIESFSPAVTPDVLGSSYFDARGLARLWGTHGELARRIATAVHHRLSMTARVGLGPTRFVAQIAARLAEQGTTIVVSSTPADFLANLPAEHLYNNAEMMTSDIALFKDRLRMLGISTIGQFMRLPAAEMMEQFGPAGVAAYQLAYGNADSPILPRMHPAALQHTEEFEPPLGDATAFARAVSGISAALAAALESRYQACQTVILRLELDDDASPLEETAQLREPTAQATALARAALRLGERVWRKREMLGGGARDWVEATPEPRISAIQIVVTGLVSEGGRQLDLFDTQRRRFALEGAADEVKRRFGDRLKRATWAPAGGGLATPLFALHDYFEQL